MLLWIELFPGIIPIFFFLKPGLKIREENISPLDTMNWTSHCKNLLSITKGEFYFGPLLYLFSVHVWHGRKVVRRKNQELWSSHCRPGSVIPILWGSRTDTEGKHWYPTSSTRKYGWITKSGHYIYWQKGWFLSCSRLDAPHQRARKCPCQWWFLLMPVVLLSKTASRTWLEIPVWFNKHLFLFFYFLNSQEFHE